MSLGFGEGALERRRIGPEGLWGGIVSWVGLTGTDVAGAAPSDLFLGPRAFVVPSR